MVEITDQAWNLERARALLDQLHTTTGPARQPLVAELRRMPDVTVTAPDLEERIRAHTLLEDLLVTTDPATAVERDYLVAQMEALVLAAPHDPDLGQMRWRSTLHWTRRMLLGCWEALHTGSWLEYQYMQFGRARWLLTAFLAVLVFMFLLRTFGYAVPFIDKGATP